MNLKILDDRPVIDDTLAKAERTGYLKAIEHMIGKLDRPDCKTALGILKVEARNELLKLKRNK